ncbi:MAG: hypothetical protein KTR27_12865 [Leptolyngbyaceae cyanobacterium MAG.088]|nr:hypothetical protein [Leptolyngbyaceae cyanobacterium MAG.088]
MFFNRGSAGFLNIRLVLGFLTTFITFWVLPSSHVSAQVESSEECSFLTSPQEFNTFDRDEKIVIGRIKSRPYIVLSTRHLQESLSVLRTCVPDAFLTSSRRGSYIHIASFTSYADARALAEMIAESMDHIDVRVIHRNRLRS